MKIGILGTSFGIVHIQTFSQHPSVSEIVVFSRTPKKLEELSSQYNIQTTTNLDDILLDSSIDVVSIALPPAMHKEVAIKAMRHGKDVICEIPLCLTIEEANEIKTVSDETGKSVMVNSFMRFRPAYQYLKKVIETNEFGSLLSIQLGNKNAPMWGEHPLGLDKLPMEATLSDFDVLSWYVGELEIVNLISTELNKTKSTIDFLLKHKDVSMQMSTSSMLPVSYGVQERYEAIFEYATITYHETAWTENDNKSCLIIYTEKGKEIIHLPKKNHYYESLSYSLECIKNGIKGITHLDEALPALQLVIQTENLLNKGE